jgi:hypothetical protein
MPTDDRDQHDHDRDGHGDGHGHDDAHRDMMDDADLAEQFEQLVSAAHVKGYSPEEIGFGMFSATTESLLANGEQECCVMQLLMDFTSSFYEYWHASMGQEDEDWEGDPQAN